MSLSNLASPSRCCVVMEGLLEDMFGPNSPSRIRQELNYINALKSDVNLRDVNPPNLNQFSGKGIPTAGQKPSFELKWERAICGGTTAQSVSGLCATQSSWTDPYLYDEVTVGQVRAHGKRFTKADFLEICENHIDELAKDVAKSAYDVLFDMTTDLITAHYAINGNYPCDGTASVAATKTLNVIATEGHVNNAAFARLLHEFRLMHTTRQPIVVGGHMTNMYGLVRQLGGVGANALGAINASTPPMTMDLQVDSVIQGIKMATNSYALSWLPGAVQLLEWYRYDDRIYEELGKENYVKTTIEVDGWKFDYTLNYDPCTETYDYEISKYFDLCYVPADHFTTCHDFNTKLLWALGCGDSACSDYTC